MSKESFLRSSSGTLTSHFLSFFEKEFLSQKISPGVEIQSFLFQESLPAPFQIREKTKTKGEILSVSRIRKYVNAVRTGGIGKIIMIYIKETEFLAWLA